MMDAWSENITQLWNLFHPLGNQGYITYWEKMNEEIMLVESNDSFDLMIVDEDFEVILLEDVDDGEDAELGAIDAMEGENKEELVDSN